MLSRKARKLEPTRRGNKVLLEEFLEVECDDYTRDLLLRTLDEIPPHSTREIALNAFNALIDTQTQKATIMDELDVERSTEMTLDQMRAILTAD